nr:MAG TPA: hypothetical protein [Caudoviricetes sp.]DAS40565.1 MAG TPA: hypothetical protein [Caudoviricetes sp.]
MLHCFYVILVLSKKQSTDIFILKKNRTFFNES